MSGTTDVVAMTSESRALAALEQKHGDPKNPILFCWRCDGERPYFGEPYQAVKDDPSWHNADCPVREAIEAVANDTALAASEEGNPE